MLVLSRKPGESLLMGDDIQVTVESVRGNRVRLGIQAPEHVKIVRTEIIGKDPQPPAAAEDEQP